MQPKFIRINQLATTPHRVGRIPASPATIHRWVAAGQFPRSFRLGPNMSAWRIEDVEAWERARAVEQVEHDNLAESARAARKARARQIAQGRQA